MGGHHHHHHHHHGSGKNILIAFALNFVFACVELVGGYLTNSVAIISDAIHDFGDSLALLLSYFAEKLSLKAPDQNFTFGYRRFSILSAMLNGLILLGGSFYVITEAVSRLLAPEPVKADGMLLLAIAGIIFNSIAAYRLSKDEGINSKMVMYHLLEDILGWVAVFIVSIILLFKPIYILDPILSLMISLLIIKGVYKNLKKIILILMQQFPDNLDLKVIKKSISQLSGVEGSHAIKGWSIDDQNFYLRLHVSVSGEMKVSQTEKIKKSIKEILKSHHVKYSTIEFEARDSETCLET